MKKYIILFILLFVSSMIHAEVIFQDNFDSSADYNNSPWPPALPPDNWDASSSWGSCIITTTSEAYGGSGKCFVGGLPGGEYSAATLYKTWSGSPDELYIRFYLKWGTSWHHAVAAMSPGQKILRIYSGAIPDNEVVRFQYLGGTFGLVLLQASGMTTQDAPEGDNYTWAEYNGDAYDGGNVWRCVEIHIKMNTTYSAPYDGLVEYWIDGDKKGTWANVRMRPDGTYHLNGMQLPENVASLESGTNYLYLDNVVIATEYIGPVSNGSSPSTPTITGGFGGSLQ